jgi:hypothetical protein
MRRFFGSWCVLFLACGTARPLSESAATARVELSQGQVSRGLTDLVPGLALTFSLGGCGSFATAGFVEISIT